MTCIFERYILNTFNSKGIPTNTASFQPKSLFSPDGKCEIQFLIWDTAGQEAYHSLASFYYRDADAIFAVYDITNTRSYDSLNFWLSEIKQKAQADCLLSILGNKCDCIDMEIVSEETASILAKSNNAAFYQVSAKEDINIANAFMNAAMRKFPKLLQIFNYEVGENGIINESNKVEENAMKLSQNRIQERRKSNCC